MAGAALSRGVPLHALMPLPRLPQLLVLLAAPVLLGADVPEGPIIGVDLGTTYSCVAIYEHGNVEVCVHTALARSCPPSPRYPARRCWHRSSSTTRATA